MSQDRSPQARRSRRTALSADPVLLYADSSALVKLVITERESDSLARYLRRTPHTLATSGVAVVEVLRAVTIANPRARPDAGRLLQSCLLVDVSQDLLRAASRLASRDVRTLDAIHLATAESLSVDTFLGYDRRLLDAARDRGLDVLSVS